MTSSSRGWRPRDGLGHLRPAPRRRRTAPPPWLAKLSGGARLVLLAPVLGFVYGAYVSRYVAFRWAEGDYLAPVAFSLMFAAGVWLLTAPQPHVFQARRRT